MLLLSPPTPSTIPPTLLMVFGIPPSKAVTSALVVALSAMRRAHFDEEVFRMPNAYFTFNVGFIVFEGCSSLRPPQPGSPFFEPPAQTPASKSAMNHGPVPAPLPQNALPKNKVFISAYFVGSVVTLPKSQQQPLPTWVPSASSYTFCEAVPFGM